MAIGFSHNHYSGKYGLTSWAHGQIDGADERSIHYYVFRNVEQKTTVEEGLVHQGEFVIRSQGLAGFKYFLDQVWMLIYCFG